MRRQRVSVLVGDRAKFKSIAAAVRQAGLDIEQELASTGIITGTIDDKRRSGLEQVKGVDAVEDERTFSVPPPNSPVQ